MPHDHYQSEQPIYLFFHYNLQCSHDVELEKIWDYEEKVLIVRILMALLHFFKRPPLSNSLQSDLETRAVHSVLVVDYGYAL